MFGELLDEVVEKIFKKEFVAGLRKVQDLGDEEIKKYCKDPQNYERPIR